MSDAGFFPQLQLDYGIQTSCFLGSFTLEHRRRTAQPHISLVSNLCAIVEPTVEFGEDLCKCARFLHFESCLDNGYVRLLKVLRMHTDRVKAMGLQSREALLGSLYFEQLHDRKDFINVKLQNPALGLFQTMLFYILPTQNNAQRTRAGGIGTEKSSEGFFKLAYSGIYPGLKNAAAMIDALDERGLLGNLRRGVPRGSRPCSYVQRPNRTRQTEGLLFEPTFPQISKCPTVIKSLLRILTRTMLSGFIDSQFPNPPDPARANSLSKKLAEKANRVFVWVAVLVGRLESGLDNETTELGLGGKACISTPVKLAEWAPQCFLDSDANRPP
ncbi:hypothetical protein CSUB01_04082 [Colletotrichum sublineola]|uniref:Uncharacterized protein n=1 Tax=Colletotrichum sublineola TaxID=1173701 RepID=A0A066WZ62_COLSU|nr:hypothetical protein CSUB01_04082 [Colletotrichum sublineola]